MNHSDIFFEFLLKYLVQTANLSEFEKNSFWLSEYTELKEFISEKNTTHLPQIMTLLHPTFLYNAKGEWLGELTNFDNLGFRNGVASADNCQFHQVQPNSYCPFNKHVNIRGKCQADHFWPHSLGGPSILGNRVLLCQFHNIAKSNSIVETFWYQYPTWIKDYLNTLYNLKK
jgi:hypothetical protein